jgi:hypothetical protein
MKLDFMELLTQTWKIGWNHKVLWVLQMLPGLFSIVLMPFMFVANPGFLMMLPEPWNQYADKTWVLGIHILLTFVFMIPLTFVSVSVQAAGTHGALKAEKGAVKLTLRELIRESLPYFWRIFGLYFIFGGAWFLLVLSFMAVNMFGSALTFGLASLCFVPFFFLMIPIAIVGYSVLELAQAAIIEHDMRTMDAIAHGWGLFRKNALNVIILMVILYFAFAILSSLAVFPMMFPMMLLPMGLDATESFVKIMPVFFLVLFPLMFVWASVVQGILLAFFQSAWAVAYLRLNTNIEQPVEAL